jgi:hypothetical protein
MLGYARSKPTRFGCAAACIPCPPIATKAATKAATKTAAKAAEGGGEGRHRGPEWPRLLRQEPRRIPSLNPKDPP